MNRSSWIRASVVISVFVVSSPGTAQQIDTSNDVVRPTLERFASEPSLFHALASGVIPGSGQLLTGRKRGWAYLAAEAFLLTWHLHSAAVGRRERDGYRNLAFDVARAPFMPTVRDTAFPYFEHMADFVASGPFDTDPGPGLVPPRDKTTFNGSVWTLARQTFFPDLENPPPPESPIYQRALDFYRARAVGPNFLWSWEGEPAALGRFRAGIRASDDAFRRSTTLLGFVVANHLISLVDAHITRQLSRENLSVESRTAVDIDRACTGGVRVRWGLTMWF